MPKSQNRKTTAENLEEKFEQGDDVLDYFDVRKAKVISPKAKAQAAAKKLSYLARGSSAGRALVREKSARYRKKR
jgi:hypothetical protein